MRNIRLLYDVFDFRPEKNLTAALSFSCLIVALFWTIFDQGNKLSIIYRARNIQNQVKKSLDMKISDKNVCPYSVIMYFGVNIIQIICMFNLEFNSIIELI